MNKQFFLTTFIIVVCAVSACSNNIDVEIALSRDASKQLGSQLKSKLVSAMQSSGPEAEISVCNIEANNISSEVSNTNNLEVGRTSLKVRNPANQPDAWEIKQLNWFASQKNADVEVTSLEVYEIIKEDGKKIFRYMKAIPMQEPCALCHGKILAPPIEEKIKRLYPQDQAIGFKVGDIRGAFTTKIIL